MVEADGSLGARNDVHCVSIEHKLGIKASPTAVLQFGDHGGAVGYLVGEENRGLEYMFIMMNAARYAVGLQGIAVAERAYQLAAAYAKDRVQGRPVDGSLPGAGPIIHHPDVKRMLLTMRAMTEGCRALALAAAAEYDHAHAEPDAAQRKRSQAAYEFLVPLVKGFSTEMSLEVASLGVQVHGGMGFIEETGAAQYLRDAKILSIYEGTTAIQANDLVGRKTARDGGAVARAFAAQIEATEGALRASGSAAALAMARRLAEGRQAFLDVVAFVVERVRADPNAAFAGSVPYLLLAGNLAAGWQLARALLVAERKLAAGEDADFHARQDRRRPLLCRACADARARPAPQRGRRRRGGDRAAGRDVLMRLDFVSDITCPWCAIGLRALEQAIERVADTVPVELHLQPFELNPGLPAEGEPIADYAARKYGASCRATGRAAGADPRPRGRTRPELPPAHACLQHLRRAPVAALGRVAGAAARAETRVAARLSRTRREPGIARGAAGRRRRSRARPPGGRRRAGTRRTCRSSACHGAPVAAPRHRRRAGAGHRRAATDPGRAAGRGVRAGVAARCCCSARPESRGASRRRQTRWQAGGTGGTPVECDGSAGAGIAMLPG